MSKSKTSSQRSGSGSSSSRRSSKSSQPPQGRGATLVVRTRTEAWEVPVGSSRITLGRHADNDVPLEEDKRLSRFHCEILPTHAGYLLRDLGSRNGTHIDNHRISEVQLRSGDKFVIGSTLIKFVEGKRRSRRRTKSGRSSQRAARREAGGHDAPDNANEGTDVATIDELPDSRPEAITEGQFDLPGDREPGPAVASAREDADDEAHLPSIDLEVSQEDDAGPVMVGRSDFTTGSLEELVQVGRDLPYKPTAISLMNAAGKTVHTASKEKSATAETIHVLRLILYACARSGASDVHIEPKQDNGLIRLRVDGAMVKATEIPQALFRRLHSLTKVLCNIDIAKKDLVQEGRFTSKMPDRQIDYRISFTPSMFGQKLVIRVLDPLNAPQRLKDLKLAPWMFRNLRDLSKQEGGMLLFTGPTGSGKTTSLYAVLREIDTRQRNVITIEDPVEYEVPGTTQIPVEAHRGNTFNTLLRSCLRQDPDVIVLGEIRDKETATTAMQAATTGHLVLSTVHAKDSIGVVFRMLDLGVEPYLVASTLNYIMAQRLARELCPHCRMARTPTPGQSMRMGRQVEGVKTIYRAIGCEKCFGTGYTGRKGVFELLSVTDEIRDIILRKPNMAEFKKAIEMTMFTSLRESGMELVAKGITSMEEIERVLGME